jgi:glycosyltransferase involved in cell wall biosynthesis
MHPKGRPKKLTYLVNYMSATDSQHWVHIPNLLTELGRLGWDIRLVSERGGRGEEEVLGQRVTFLSRRSKWRRAVALVILLARMRSSGGRLVFVRISKFAAFASALLGRLFGWRTLFWLSGAVEDFNLRQGPKARIAKAWLGLLFRLIDRLATGPEAMVDYYAAQYQLPPAKILMLYNDIELRGVDRSRQRPKDGIHVLLVHRLSPVRETHRYFPALLSALGRSASRLDRPIVLDICGAGDEREQLERQCEKPPAGVEPRFHGAVPQRALGPFYDAAELFVMPSYREGFPRVILEAMARGLPIVSTDAGGTRDIVGAEQQSFVVDRDDADAFAGAVERLLLDPEERRRLAAENIIAVRRFSTVEVARMYDRALSKLIGAEPAA